MYKPALVAAVISGALAVVIGAFGAHGLKEIAPADQIAIYEKGVSYQFYHTFAMLGAGMLYRSYRYNVIQWAYYFFLAGIVLFSGSLYALVGLKIIGDNIGAFGFVTPLGGLLLTGGWICLLVGIIRKR